MPPMPNFLANGAAPTTHCPGSPNSPTAAPGQLCIYESADFGRGTVVLYSPLTGGGPAAALGGVAVLIPSNSTAGNVYSAGATSGNGNEIDGSR